MGEPHAAQKRNRMGFAAPHAPQLGSGGALQAGDGPATRLLATWAEADETPAGATGRRVPQSAQKRKGWALSLPQEVQVVTSLMGP